MVTVALEHLVVCPRRSLSDSDDARYHEGETHEFPEGNIIPVGASRDARDMGVIRAVLSLQVFPRRNTVIEINRLLLVGSPSL